MNVKDLTDALADFPPESEVYAESDQDLFEFDMVEIDEDGMVYLTQERLR